MKFCQSRETGVLMRRIMLGAGQGQAGAAGGGRRRLGAVDEDAAAGGIGDLVSVPNQVGVVGTTVNLTMEWVDCLDIRGRFE
jgi:hypothetical protein